MSYGEMSSSPGGQGDLLLPPLRSDQREQRQVPGVLRWDLLMFLWKDPCCLPSLSNEPSPGVFRLWGTSLSTRRQHRRGTVEGEGVWGVGFLTGARWEGELMISPFLSFLCTGPQAQAG